MKGKFEDLTGSEFERLKVEGYIGNGRWLCKCKCGNKAIVRTDALKTGHSTSCGCFQKEKVTKHGFWNTEYSKGTMKFYKMWQSLKARCDNPNLRGYKNYGGRGITYDPKWKTFEGFKQQMIVKYVYAVKVLGLKNASLERKDVNGNYCFSNCIFIERNDQLKNTRNVISFIAISPEGQEITVRNVNAFSKEHGLNSSHVYECLIGKASHHKGWVFKPIETSC